MRNIRLYEKVRNFKKENLSNEEIIDKLTNDNGFSLVDVVESIHDREAMQILGQQVRDYYKDIGVIDDHNEYGIPMINTDADW